MDTELATILRTHKPKTVRSEQNTDRDDLPPPSIADIPDVFFDDVLVNIRLSRVEIIVLVSLYRRVWCRPNLYKKYGISPLLSYEDLERNMRISVDELHSALHRLESLGLIETIRHGQYFIRRFFTEKLDQYYHQGYDDF